jgi:hypothetical protein
VLASDLSGRKEGLRMNPTLLTTLVPVSRVPDTVQMRSLFSHREGRGRIFGRAAPIRRRRDMRTDRG